MSVPGPEFSIDYDVLGTPIAEGRGRAVRRGRHIRVVTPMRTCLGRQEHLTAFQAAREEQCPGPWEPWTGAVVAKIRVYHRRPQREWWPGKACMRKPDLDNVAKLVLDALSGFAYVDDTHVVRLAVWRNWADTDSVEVQLDFWPSVPKPKKGKKQ